MGALESEFAFGSVIADRVSGDVVEGLGRRVEVARGAADDDGELDLPIALGRAARDQHAIVRPGNRVRSLEEVPRPVGVIREQRGALGAPSADSRHFHDLCFPLRFRRRGEIYDEHRAQRVEQAGVNGDVQLTEGVFNTGVDVAQPRVDGERQSSAVAQQPDALDAADRDAAYDGAFVRPGGQVQVDVAATVFPYAPG